MIGIQLDGDSEFLDTPPDVSISMRLENPLLTDDDKISKGSYTYPFRLPGGSKSEKNSKKLRNPDVIENSEVYVVQKATLFASSAPDSNVIPFKKGVIKPLDSDAGSINSYFLFGLSTISDDFKTAKLRDVISENIQVSNTPITKKIYLKRTTAGDYKITVNGTQHVAADIDSIVGSINATFNISLDSGNYTPHALRISSGSTPSGLITAPYVSITISRYDTVDFLGTPTPSITASIDPLQELHVTTEDDPDDYLIEADLGTYYSEFTTFMAGYISGTYPNSKLRFPLVLNGNAFPETVKDTQWVNAVDSTGFIKNDPNWGLNNDQPFQVRNYNSLLPMLRRKWILDKIAEEFDFLWDGDFYAHVDLEDMLEFHTVSLDVAQGFIGDKKFVFWRRSFNLSELVPDITVVEYLRRLKQRYNLAIYFNERTQRVRMAIRESVARISAYQDVTEISTPAMGNEDQRVTGFNLLSSKEDNDALSFEEKVSIGTPEQDINTECGRVYLYATDIIDSKIVFAPKVMQLWNTGDKLRTIYYKGLTDVTTFNYPAADINGALITEQLTDPLVGYGLYNAFWKYWLHFQRRRRIVKLRVDFPLRELVKFDFEQKRRFNRVNYLVKSIDVSITNQTVRVKNVEFATMN